MCPSDQQRWHTSRSRGIRQHSALNTAGPRTRRSPKRASHAVAARCTCPASLSKSRAEVPWKCARIGRTLTRGPKTGNRAVNGTGTPPRQPAERKQSSVHQCKLRCGSACSHAHRVHRRSATGAPAFSGSHRSNASSPGPCTSSAGMRSAAPRHHELHAWSGAAVSQ
jgi:hypothetical protein